MVTFEDAVRGRGIVAKQLREDAIKKDPTLTSTFSRIGRDSPVIGLRPGPAANSEVRAIPSRAFTSPSTPAPRFRAAMTNKELKNMHVKDYTKWDKEERTNDYSDYMINHKSIQVKNPNKKS